MDKVRFGLVGIGAQGGAYAGFLTGRGGFPGMPAPECPPHCALGALCDTDPAKEAMCKEKYPETPFFKDWKDLVDSLSPHRDCDLLSGKGDECPG